jgi:hypothetical protein
MGKLIAIVVTAGVCILAFGALAGGWLGHRPEPKPVAVIGAATDTPTAAEGAEPIIVRSSATWPDVSLAQRIQTTGTIVVGTIGQPYPSRWNTSSGGLPPGTTLRSISTELAIFTDYPVSVESTLKGDPPGKTVRVRALGGRVGKDRYISDAEPPLKPGQRVVLFLSREDPRAGHIGPPHYTVNWGALGAYTIVGDQVTNDTERVSMSELQDLIATNPGLIVPTPGVETATP